MNLHTDSLWIGNFLRQKIEKSVPVYPCIAPADAPPEFCVYRRVGYSGRDTKDRYNYEEELSVAVMVASPSYMRGLEMAQNIKESLECLRTVWDGKPIDRILMTNASEEYGGNTYVQTLYFTITLDTSRNR